jgi:hypothetical protein
MGCDFATKSCKELMELGSTMGPDGVERPVPFCNTLMTSTTKTSCTEDLTSVGNCNLVTFGEDLPKMYQNFDTIDGVTRKEIGKVIGRVLLFPRQDKLQLLSKFRSADQFLWPTSAHTYRSSPGGQKTVALPAEEVSAKTQKILQVFQEGSCQTEGFLIIRLI